MVKREKKSLASLIGNREINPDAIEEAAAGVHKAQEKEKKPVAVVQGTLEKNIRVSVDTPRSLYMKCKEAAFAEDIGSLKDFYLHCVNTYLKEKGRL